MENSLQNTKEILLAALKEAKTRGGFKVSDFAIEANLQKQPVSIKGKVYAVMQGATIKASETETIEMFWNLQGCCIKGNIAAFDLVIII